MEVQLIYYPILIAWIITKHDYIQGVFTTLYIKGNKYVKLLIDTLSCFKCASFWIVGIWTCDVFLAIFASAIAYLYDSITER